MLGKPSEQYIPALVTGRVRHNFEQPQTSPRWLLVVLLEELNDQPPLRVEGSAATRRARLARVIGW
jgi:hypothetical protein